MAENKPKIKRLKKIISTKNLEDLENKGRVKCGARKKERERGERVNELGINEIASIPIH